LDKKTPKPKQKPNAQFFTAIALVQKPTNIDFCLLKKFLRLAVEIAPQPPLAAVMDTPCEDGRLTACLRNHWYIFRLKRKHADSAVFAVGLVLRKVRETGQNQISVNDHLHHTSMIIQIFKYIFNLFTIERQKVKKA